MVGTCFIYFSDMMILLIDNFVGTCCISWILLCINKCIIIMFMILLTCFIHTFNYEYYIFTFDTIMYTLFFAYLTKKYLFMVVCLLIYYLFNCFVFISLNCLFIIFNVYVSKDILYYVCMHVVIMINFNC